MLIDILRMQEGFGEVAEGFTQEFGIQCLDFRVFPAGTYLFQRIQSIERFDAGAFGRDFLRQFRPRLATAADAAARAGHDFDESVFLPRMFFFHEVDEAPGIGQTADGDDADDIVIQGQCRLFDAFQATDFFKVQKFFVSRFARLQIDQGPQSRFHDAAAVAKNRTAAGRLAKDGVIIRILQAVEVDLGVFDPFRQFTSRNAVVRIADFRLLPIAAGSIPFRPGNFSFLRRTRRDADRHDVGRIDLHAFGKIGLDHRTEHADRALGRRQVRNQFREKDFRKFNPRRAAAGELRQEFFLIVHAVQEFRCFFHDGQVSAEVRIEDVIPAESPQGGNHLALDDGAEGQAKFIAKSDADSRCRLEDDDFLRVIDCLLDGIALGYSRRRTEHARQGTLAAVDANRHVTRTFQRIIARHGHDIGTAPTAKGTVLALFRIELDGNIAVFDGDAAVELFKAAGKGDIAFLFGLHIDGIAAANGDDVGNIFRRTAPG